MESSLKQDSQTETTKDVKETSNITVCDQLEWFKLDPLDKKKRIRSTSDSCQAIYIPPGGPFTNYNDPEKHKICTETFDWYDEEVDQRLPSNGCLRHVYHTEMLGKNVKVTTEPPRIAEPSNEFLPGCYHCNVEKNERGCIGQNKHYNNEAEATKACSDDKECSIIIKYTKKDDTRFYLRRSTDHSYSDSNCMYKLVS